MPKMGGDNFNYTKAAVVDGVAPPPQYLQYLQ